jgi:hypothetical protein
MDLKPTHSTPPDPSEYAPYHSRYIAQVPAGDLLETLAAQLQDVAKLVSGLTAAQGDHRYAPGKWSIKEVLGHVSDTERVFAYRALRIARGDRTPLPGFDQDRFMQAAPFATMSLAGIADEFTIVRRASLALLGPLAARDWERRGIVNDHEVSLRAIAWMIAGHERHHVAILRERYLS